jgi:hypothetical protein
VIVLTLYLSLIQLAIYCCPSVTASSSSALCIISGSINAFSFYRYHDVNVKCYQKWADTELKFQRFLPLVVDGMSCVYPLHYYFYLRTLYGTVFTPIHPFFPPLYCFYHYSSYFYLVCTVFTPRLFYFYLLCTVHSTTASVPNGQADSRRGSCFMRSIKFLNLQKLDVL